MKENIKEGFFEMGRCRVIVSVDEGKWHLSISAQNSLPSYEELKEARYKFLPNDIYAAQIFPPKEEFVNMHPYCFHLWEM